MTTGSAKRHALAIGLACTVGACGAPQASAPLPTSGLAVAQTVVPAATEPASPSTAPAVATAAGPIASRPPTSPSGATVKRTIDLPGDGEVIYEHGILWAEDRQNQVLHQIDPSTGSTVRSIPGVLGGFMTFRDGIVWMSSYVLDRLLRIDPSTAEVRRIDTGKGEAGTEAVAGTARGIWVANHVLGTVALYDGHGKVIQTVTVSPRDIQGPQSMVADKTTLWVGIPDLHELTGIRLADGKVLHHVTLQWWPSGAPCVGDGRVWVTSAGDGLTTEVDAASGTVNRILDIGASTGRCVLAFGALWFPTLEPGGLVRVDPASGAVTGRLELPAPALSIAASEGSLWVRLEGSLLEIKPATD